MKHFTSMKRWSFMVFVTIASVFTASSQCTWSLDGQDSFGDGWNGGSLEILDNGVPVTGSPFAVAGSADSWSFTVTDGNTIELNWTAGGFLGEVSFQLLDDQGNTVYDQPSPAPASGQVYTGTITCTPCTGPVDGLFANNFTASTADMNWNALFGATTYDVEWGLQGFTPGSGNELGSVLGTTNTTETATGLSANTVYDFYVNSDCGTGWSLAFSFQLPCILTTPATLPFTDDFEAATTATVIGDAELECMPSYKWDYATNDQAAGRIRYGDDAITSLSGTGAFTLDRSNTTATSTSEAILTIDLSDYSGSPELGLAFDWMHHGEEDNAGDRVWARGSDSDPWIEIFDFTPITSGANAGQWINETFIDVLTPLAGNGQTLTSSFQIRFGQEDNFDATSLTASDGLTIDNVSLFNCLPVQNITLTGSDTTTASFSWTSGAGEWIIEYGLEGFTPGTGDSIFTTQNPDTLTGLTPDEFYDVYITSICGPGDTSNAVGPININTYDQGLYMEADTECPLGGFIDISTTGTNLNLTDDGEASVDPLPFPILFQGTLMTNVTIGNNGGLQLGTTTANIGYGGNFNTLPDGTMFPWGDDLDEETGDVYVQQVGTSPNSTLVVQWENSCNFAGAIGDPTVTFQIQLDEATGEIFYVYEDVIFGGADANDDYASNASIGISGPNQDITTSDDDPEYLQNNSCVRYYYTDCPKPANYNNVFIGTDTVNFSWDAGLSGETEWEVIYGEEGFDPLNGGTSVIVNSGSSLGLNGLEDVTTYDVYIMALCANGDTSVALVDEFRTLPYCADPTTLAGSTAVDSIFTSWDFTMNSGYPISEFAIEYGQTGFNNGDGTYAWGIDTINYTDTLFDASLMGGGLYDVYIQSVCLTGDSSNWVGPITVTMPLTNDSTCFSEEIPVDNTVYTFDGAGATSPAAEAAIAPAAGPCDGNMTWCNSAMSATTWFTFTAPASGNVRIDGEEVGFDGQVAVYETSDCSDYSQYTLVGANDDFDLSGNNYPYLNLCGLTPGNTYYLTHDPSGGTGIYSLRVQEIVVEAGTDNGLLDVCRGDTVDLNTQISGNDADGTWSEEFPTAGFNDPMWVTSGLAAQVYTFEYTVVDGCATDSVETNVEIYGPSSAGDNGSLTVCLNEPINLFDGLNGNVDLGGTWYDPSNDPLPNSQPTASNIPGNYNFDYITTNGVCPADTALVEVVVDGSCDWLSIGTEAMNEISVYPNPATDMINVVNPTNMSALKLEIVDMNGRVVATDALEDSAEGSIAVDHLETGIYTLRVYGENGQKTFKIVKK